MSKQCFFKPVLGKLIKSTITENRLSTRNISYIYGDMWGDKIKLCVKVIQFYHNFSFK